MGSRNGWQSVLKQLQNIILFSSLCCVLHRISYDNLNLKSFVHIHYYTLHYRCAAELIFTLSGHDAVTAVCLAPDDKHLVTGDSSGKIRVWDVVSCETIHFFSLHTKAICAVAMTTTW